MKPLSLIRRPRRLRTSPAIRGLVRENHLSVDDLVLPLFVVEGEKESQPIASMPGQHRWSIDRLCVVAEEAALFGIKAVALFPVLAAERKDARGSEALNPETLLLRAIRALKAAVPELVLIADVALDPYTTHGHDGVLTADGTQVANDETVAILAQMAVLQAAAGIDLVAPSDMMDGRIGAIRQALDGAGYSGTGILSYSVKYASAYYGPFREALGSAAAAGTKYLGKQGYQMDPANRREALVETDLDEKEGADILMVKPAGLYLDIIRELRDRTALPVAAFQVSGEYAQIHAAARLGWLDLPRCRDESLLAIKRAGADLIFTYFALEVARSLSQASVSSVDEMQEQGRGMGI